MRNNDEHLDVHFELCKRAYERMLEDGAWPWEDSTTSDDLLECEDNKSHT